MILRRQTSRIGDGWIKDQLLIDEPICQSVQLIASSLRRCADRNQRGNDQEGADKPGESHTVQTTIRATEACLVRSGMSRTADT